MSRRKAAVSPTQRATCPGVSKPNPSTSSQRRRRHGADSSAWMVGGPAGFQRLLLRLLQLLLTNYRLAKTATKYVFNQDFITDFCNIEKVSKISKKGLNFTDYGRCFGLFYCPVYDLEFSATVLSLEVDQNYAFTQNLHFSSWFIWSKNNIFVAYFNLGVKFH